MPGTFCKRFDDRLRQWQGLIEADAVADLIEKGEPFEDVLLRLFAEALELGDVARVAAALSLARSSMPS